MTANTKQTDPWLEEIVSILKFKLMYHPEKEKVIQSVCSILDIAFYQADICKALSRADDVPKLKFANTTPNGRRIENRDIL